MRRHLIRRTEADGTVVIEDLVSDKAVPHRWKVFETSAAIRDSAALEDATAVHYRETVPLIWAAPVGAARDPAGRFFAFFPTTTETRALGILNAPWKLNSDRTALIPGAWNTALMKAAAELIAQRIADLSSSDDPGAVLDAFPRELQSASEPAAPLVQSLWKLLVDAPVIPNCDGELRRAAGLRTAPTDDSEIIEAWSHLAPPEECERHVHPSCTSTTARTSRLSQLADRLDCDEDEGLFALESMDSARWLELTATVDSESAANVLELVDRFAAQETGYWWEAQRSSLKVILTEDGAIECAANVVMGDSPEPPLRSVHHSLSADENIRRILQQRFHVRDSAEMNAIQLIDARMAQAARSGDWSAVWQALRGIPFEEACRIVHQRAIRVKTHSGWGRPTAVFRIGELVTQAAVDRLADEKRDEAAALIVDAVWHAEDHALLDEMGIEANPETEWIPYEWPQRAETIADRWMNVWKTTWLDRYNVRLGGRIGAHQLRASAFEMPSGWEWLLLFEDSERQALTHWIMESIEAADDDEFGAVEFHHANRYAQQPWQYPHPVWSLLLERGVIGREDVTLPFWALMRADMPERAAILPSLQSWSEALEKLKDAGEDWNSTRKDEEAWPLWLTYASREGCAPQAIATLYELAAQSGHAPSEVPTTSGPVAISEIYLASSLRDAEMAGDAGLTALYLGKDATKLWKEKGARDLSDHRQTEWDAHTGAEVIRLTEFEPTFAEVLTPAKADEACVSLVRDLRQNLGGKTVPAPWLLENGIVLVDEETFTGGGWVERIAMLVDAATTAGWTSSGDALDRILQSGPAARRRLVAEEPDLAARLLKALGGSGPLLNLFEPQIRILLTGDPVRTAEVSLTLFGPSLLALVPIKEAMKNEGLDPPTGWSGARASDFVAAIGFPPEYAVAPQRKREAELSVDGPVPMKPLHDFQQDVAAHLDDLFEDRTKKRRRAVISLPTGAGKTRVAAETAVTRILTPGGPNRLVLWIAQSDELCEQAVQCFRQLWANLGSEDEPLRIVRFWGGHGNPRSPEAGDPTVVVATIQTLDSRMGQPGTDWIRSPALAVIDECHHALTTSYTGAFNWLKGNADEGTPEPPVIGLSATPFRGRNEEETQALARRFDGRLFPQGQAELFDDLQERGVLARFRYSKLEIRERFELTTEEEISLKRFNKLPSGAMERLGSMGSRNDRIVHAIKQANEQSALVFATSVAHARRLAARLNLLGVKAAAVTGETDRNSRRWFIEAFRRGDIRVLCNHSALTTGFDAPATDLIVIARPVFSPSLYMQMVGRGLRGPVNGGKEECRILTVQDNLDQYTGLLAHHFFERHYVDS